MESYLKNKVEPPNVNNKMKHTTGKEGCLLNALLHTSCSSIVLTVKILGIGKKNY